MTDNQTDNKLNRRALLNQSVLTGLAIAAGVIGVSISANAQSSPDVKLDVKNLKRSSRRKTDKLITAKSTATRQDYQQSIEKLKSIKEQIYQIRTASGGKFDHRLNTSLSRIEIRPKVTVASVYNGFAKNNVEVLLDQASNLLNRALQDRMEWDSLSINLFSLGIEIGQFIEYDEIHYKETAAGFYDQAVNDKTNALNIDKQAKDKLQYLYDLFSQMSTDRWSTDEMNTIANLHAQISELENAGNHGPQIKPLTLTLAQYRLAIDYVYNMLQQEGLATSLEQTKMRVDNDNSKLNWETANRDFRQQRTEVERKYEYIKLLSLQAEDGVLNYTKRIAPLKERFQNDFSEALLRMTAAADGLKEIYGYTTALPKDDNEPDYFDRCIVWVRQAINFIIKFSRFDQSYVVPISIKKLYLNAGKTAEADNWDKAIEAGVLKFMLTVNNFPDTSFVRIKGISIFFQLGELNKHSFQHISHFNGALSAYITPPPNSYYNHNGNSVSVNQAYVPNLRLNRLATRDFIRPPEIGGASLYANLSPIGDWQIELPQIKQEQINTLFAIEDIIMDLYITVNRFSNQ